MLNNLSPHDKAKYERANNIPDLYEIQTMLGADEALERCGDGIKCLQQIKDPPVEVKEEETRLRDVWKCLLEVRENLLKKKFNFDQIK